MVRELGVSRYGEGAHALAWDGRNQAGVPAAGGVYIFTLRVDGKTWRQRMLLSR
jgi:hypothetical protein